jgi:uncharacterized protein
MAQPRTKVTPIGQVLLKLHSRCNLSCDYCYVYHHVDQRWRTQPMTMSRETVDHAAHRIGEHARRHRIPRVTVILHGGEPLLAGPELIDYAARAVTSALPSHTTVGLHVQTNGVLIDPEFLEVFDRHRIRVGVSVDGDKDANDRHRRYTSGAGSYPAVARGIELLRQERYRHLYSGLLCTVDVRNDPLEVYESLLRFQPPRLDFLLPHGNWTNPPPGYDPHGDGTPYADWLIRIFDAWYDAPRKPTDIRLFRSIVELLGGGHTASEALGLDPVDLLVIETDGTIEQGDALKTVADGASATGLTLSAHTFDDALEHPGIRARQLGLDGLSAQCRACPIVAVCGGGLYAHRYRADNGFDNPTVYCRDQLKLIGHVRDRFDSRVRRVFGPARQAGGVAAVPAAAAPAKLETYEFTAAQFADLGAGYGDRSAVELLRSAQASKRRLLLHAVLRGALNTAEWVEWSLTDSWQLLEAATAAGGPAVSDEVLHHPFVDAWATRCLAALRAAPQPQTPVRHDLAYLPALAAAAALRAGMAFELPVPAPDGRIVLPSLGLAHGLGAGVAKVAGDGQALTIAGTHRTVAVPAPYTVDGPWWYPRRQVTAESAAGTLTVAIEDLDPYRSCFRLPPEDRLSPPALDRTAEVFGAAWRLIGEHHPRHAQALRVALRGLVPLRAPAKGDTSAAARTAFGAIATSTPARGTELAQLLIHEMQHMKLGAILDLVDLYDRADGSLHHAPWRADPRPVGALLQGVYAHTGVTDYWRVQRHLESGPAARAAEVEFAYWLEQTRRAAGTVVGSGTLTPHGERFLRHLTGTLEAWRYEAVSAGSTSGARDLVLAGTVRWRLANLRPAAAEVDRVAAARRGGAPCPPLAAPPHPAPAPAAPAVPDGLAARIRSALAGDPDGGTGDPAVSAYLGGDFGAATARYRAAAGADPSIVDTWVGLALSADRSVAQPGARVLAERPELVRAVFTALGADRAGAPDELAAWLAGGLAAG